MRRFAVVLSLVVLVLAAALAFRIRLQRAAARAPPGGSGEIEGTDVHVSARITARVVALPVEKGSEVKRGDVLAVLDCADAQAALAEAAARLAAAQAQAAASAASVDASRRQREAAAAGQRAAAAQSEALAAQRDAAQRQAARLARLDADVSLERRDQSAAGATGLEHQAAAARAQARASEDQARAATAALRAAGAQSAAAEAQTTAARATADRARLLAEECQVRAPREGVLDDLPHEVGELVAAGQPLAKLVDLREVKATFYLPNAELAAARPGATATVVADAWPAERFEGVVRTVSARAEFTPRNIQTRSDRDRLVYPVEVWIANPSRKLRPGMPVQVRLPAVER